MDAQAANETAIDEHLARDLASQYVTEDLVTKAESRWGVDAARLNALDSSQGLSGMSADAVKRQLSGGS